jgi:hypothetical protein
MGWRTGVKFFCLHSVQAGCEAHTTTYLIDTGLFCLEWSGRSVKPNTRFYLVPKSRKMEQYSHPIRLHDTDYLCLLPLLLLNGMFRISRIYFEEKMWTRSLCCDDTIHARYYVFSNISSYCIFTDVSSVD